MSPQPPLPPASEPPRRSVSGRSQPGNAQSGWLTPRGWLVLALLAAAGLVGVLTPHSCVAAPRVAGGEAVPKPAAVAPVPAAAGPAAAPKQPVEEEHWFEVELLGQRAGYLHTRVQHVEHQGRPAISTREELRQEVARLNGGLEETIIVRSSTEWLEAPGGGTLRLESHMDQGAGDTVTVIEVEGKRARLRQRGAGGERRAELDWDESILGPRSSDEAVQRVLSGELRTARYQTFSVEAGHRVLDVEVRLVERLPDGGAVIEQTLGGLGISTREVYDAEGELVEQQIGPVTLRRSTRAEALAPLESSLEAFEKITVALDRTLPHPRELKRGAYRLRLRDGDDLALQDLFPEDRRQRVERRAGGSVLVVTVPADPSDPPPATAPPGGARRYLEASGLIESDDPAIRSIARRVAGTGGGTLVRARRLEAWVAENVHYRGAGVGLATARQTLDSRDGDCTENAFLLAALLRAAGIPSRVVVGLVYAGATDQGGRMVPHAWVEAWAGDWVALDSALHAPRVDATHLAMAKSAGGEEGAVLDVTVPLLRGLGRFDLEWVAEP